MNKPMITVTSNYAERTQIYKVRMVCGHIENRRMRPATAGVPWTPDTIIDAPTAKCAACRGEVL